MNKHVRGAGIAYGFLLPLLLLNLRGFRPPLVLLNLFSVIIVASLANCTNSSTANAASNSYCLLHLTRMLFGALAGAMPWRTWSALKCACHSHMIAKPASSHLQLAVVMDIVRLS